MNATPGVDDSDAGSVIDASTGQTAAGSIYSFSSSRDGSAMLRESDGRIFNSQNELYYLPADDIEFSRLDKQHLVHLLGNDGLVHRGIADRVRAVLSPSNPTPDGSPRRVLDLGCGGGNWAISMALEFPQVEVVGVDLAPNTTRPPPPNCRFEFDDFNLGMSHYHEMFDVVHARSCANGVTNFRDFIQDMGLCLRPGGVVLVMEGDFQLLSPTREPQEIAYSDGNPNKSWMARLLFEAHVTMGSRGSQVEAGVNLYPWLCQNALFQDQDWAKIVSPVGPWERGHTAAETRKLEIIGELMRQNSLEFIRALKPVLIMEGYSTETVDRFIRGADKELSTLTPPMYAQWHYAWAIRKADPEPGLTPASEATAPPGNVSEAALYTPTALPQTSGTISGPSNQGSILAPSTSTSGSERMTDVELWAAQSTETPVTLEPNAGSDHDSQEEFDAVSDGDTDIESVVEE